MSESGFPGFKDLQDVDFIHSSVYSFICSSVYSFIHLLIYPFVDLFICQPARPPGVINPSLIAQVLF